MYVINHSVNQSSPSLFDAPGTKAFASEKRVKLKTANCWAQTIRKQSQSRSRQIDGTKWPRLSQLQFLHFSLHNSS